MTSGGNWQPSYLAALSSSLNIVYSVKQEEIETGIEIVGKKEETETAIDICTLVPISLIWNPRSLGFDFVSHTKAAWLKQISHVILYLVFPWLWQRWLPTGQGRLKVRAK